jgi:hypothetical protein
VFYIDVAKVDRDVTHIAMVVHICFNYIFQMFYLFQTSVATGCCIYIVFQLFSYICCKCFHLDFVMFAMATHMFSSFLVFCNCFRHMLQLFQLFWTYVASVLSECCKRRSDVAHVEWDPLAAAACCSCWGAIERANGPHLRSSGAGDIWTTWALRGHA